MKLKKEILGWCLFDVANSSYTTLIVTVAFGVVFTKIIVGPDTGGGFQFANALWSTVLAASWGIAGLLGPLLGTFTDRRRQRKHALAVSVCLCAVSSAMLAWCGPGDVGLACILVIASNIGYALSENFIAAFLPHLSGPESTGQISGLGWGLGYFGGLLSVLLAQAVTGLDYRLENLSNLRWIGPLVGVFFVLASLPSLLWLKEPAGVGLEARGKSWREVLSSSKSLAPILLSCFFYQGGIAIVISFTALYAEQEMRMPGSMQALLFITLQISAGVGAFFFGWLQTRLHPLSVLNATLYLWLAAIVGIYFIRPIFGADNGVASWAFLVCANVAGLGLGATQSGGRVLVSLVSARENSGACFGLWGTSVKWAQVVSLIAFGFAQAAFPIRHAMLLCVFFFFVPLLIHRALDKSALR